MASCSRPRDSHALKALRPTKCSTETWTLVVEDDADVRHFIIECLESHGCRVRCAANGAEALDRLPDERPDLLMVDFAMPGMNGAEVVQKAWSLHPKLPVLMATGYADMEMVEKIIPAECVLRKPFRSEDLLRAVNSILVEAEVNG